MPTLQSWKLWKFLKNISLFVLAALLFTACGKSAALAPDDVAVNLYNGLTSGDVDFVKKHIYFSAASDYTTFCDYLDMAVESNDFRERTASYKADYYAVDTKIFGNEAYVELCGLTPLNGTAKMTVHLLFVDGKWKVDGDHGVFHKD